MMYSGDEDYGDEITSGLEDDPGCFTEQCSCGDCANCTDVDGNCCECSCHLGLDELDHNDEVLCCPDCEKPNQFGELCDGCRRSDQERLMAAEEEA